MNEAMNAHNPKGPTNECDNDVGRVRVALVREELARQGLDGFLVLHEDEQQCEYTPMTAEEII